MSIRALTFLNETGDATIAWTQDRDDEMEAIIEKKMAEGVIFYLIDPRFGTREKLRSAGDAARHRALAIRDEDFARFVGIVPSDTVAPVEATASIVETPAAPVKGARRSKQAKEVAQGESVAVRPRRGG